MSFELKKLIEETSLEKIKILDKKEPLSIDDLTTLLVDELLQEEG